MVSSAYDQNLDLGFVFPDEDGVTRETIVLDAATGYYLAMTAYNEAGQSEISNEIFVAASACDPLACDDGNPCTADDCSEAGCTHVTLPDGEVRDDGLPGTVGDRCLAGACYGMGVSEVVPASVGPGTHRVEVRGIGFAPGVTVAFEDGEGPAPKVCSVRVIDVSTLEVEIQVNAQGPPRPRLWDVGVLDFWLGESWLDDGLRVDP